MVYENALREVTPTSPCVTIAKGDANFDILKHY